MGLKKKIEPLYAISGIVVYEPGVSEPKMENSIIYSVTNIFLRIIHKSVIDLPPKMNPLTIYEDDQKLQYS